MRNMWNQTCPNTWNNTWNDVTSTGWNDSTEWDDLIPIDSGTITTIPVTPSRVYTQLATATAGRSSYRQLTAYGAPSNTVWTELHKPLKRPALRVMDGEQQTIHLPDGTVIEVKKDGSYEIQDKDAKVIYRANRIRDFNAFLNASDKMEAFIRFCGEHGVRRGEMLDLPVKHFIAWLILEAAKADQEEQPDVPLLADLRREASQPRCVSCGRFMPRRRKRAGLTVCRTLCFERQQLALAA